MPTGMKLTGYSRAQSADEIQKSKSLEENLSAGEEVKIFDNPQPVEQTPSKKDNVALKTDLTLEEFETYLQKEFGCSLSENDQNDFIKKQFDLILKNMSDDEKIAKKMLVLELSCKPELIDMFFNSFDDVKKAQECADGIDLKTRESLAENVHSIIIKHMSAPGSKKLLRDCGARAEDIYNNNKKIIEELFKSDLTEVERLEKINKLPEKNEILEYCKLAEISIAIVHAAITNPEKYTPEDSEEIITIANNTYEKQPIHNVFLEKMAKIISDDSNNLNIDKSKLTELLDKLNDNKFSEAIQKQAAKNAVDETGKFKTAPAEVITQSEEKIQEIKQNITETPTPEPVIAEKTNNEAEITKSSENIIVDYVAITGNHSIEVIKDVFSGKIKIAEHLEKAAIKQYKLLDSALQGNMLLSASGKFFNDLVKNTKTSTLENLLAIGWKGKSFYATQKVKDEAEERKDDVA